MAKVFSIVSACAGLREIQNQMAERLHRLQRRRTSIIDEPCALARAIDDVCALARALESVATVEDAFLYPCLARWVPHASRQLAACRQQRTRLDQSLLGALAQAKA